MQNRLTLLAAAIQVAWPAILTYLGDVPLNGFPTSDLPGVVETTAAHEIATIPLEPAAWIFVIDPAFGHPFGQRLRGVHSEEVEFGIVKLVAQPRVAIPLRRKFVAAVGHVFATKHPQGKHLGGRKLGSKLGIEVFADRLGSQIDIALLHQVVYNDAAIWHFVAGLDKNA